MGYLPCGQAVFPHRNLCRFLHEVTVEVEARSVDPWTLGSRSRFSCLRLLERATGRQGAMPCSQLSSPMFGFSHIRRILYSTNVIERESPSHPACERLRNNNRCRLGRLLFGFIKPRISPGRNRQFIYDLPPQALRWVSRAREFGTHSDLLNCKLSLILIFDADLR